MLQVAIKNIGNTQEYMILKTDGVMWHKYRGWAYKYVDCCLQVLLYKNSGLILSLYFSMWMPQSTYLWALSPYSIYYHKTDS